VKHDFIHPLTIKKTSPEHQLIKILYKNGSEKNRFTREINWVSCVCRCQL